MDRKISCSLAVGLAVLFTPTSNAQNPPSAAEMWQAIQDLQKENKRLRQELSLSSVNKAQTLSNEKNTDTQVKEDSEFSFKLGRFIRADVGHGDRYGNGHGDDRLGITKAAVAIISEYENIKGVFVVGTEITSLDDPNEDGDVDIKDAFIVIQDFGWQGFDVTMGAQPLLIGLKPEGYPGDHSIQGSIEYGAGDAFAFSNQAGPALTADWRYSDTQRIRLGVFDQKDYFNSGSIDVTLAEEGSDFSDNYYLQWTGSDLLGSGFYANLVYESRYIGGMINNNEDIWGAGLGWQQGPLDLSLEYVSLDKAFNATLDDESYLIAESSYSVNENASIYFDYSEADELDIKTYRLGMDYQYNAHTTFSVEYNEDDMPGEDLGSLDLRVNLHY
ncbi:hypothetical protein [Thalassomonas haliotis]|uniref:Porin n=1 Tax=Thalassomonas haliotis TaxID=485448 RepID=A0ABY7VGC8_9GAMM|nr:hypothetical protein [Thalassomonas haliotis]WDE12616.1 hypothetical protein H3N35_03825 [Thalassomonas haliotis]